MLAGGTALALQLGHRISRDLDSCRPEPLDPEALLHDLTALGRVAVRGRAERTLHLALGGLRVRFSQAQASLLFPGTPSRDLLLADPRDIAVMKVIAIGGGGTLDAVFELLRRRSPRLDHYEYHLLRSLVYFDDAETERMPRLIGRVSWREIKAAIAAEVRRLS